MIWDAVTCSYDVTNMIIRWSMLVPFVVKKHSMTFGLLLDGTEPLPEPMLAYTEQPSEDNLSSNRQ